jgi:hypothetical protein
MKTPKEKPLGVEICTPTDVTDTIATFHPSPITDRHSHTLYSEFQLIIFMNYNKQKLRQEKNSR